MTEPTLPPHDRLVETPNGTLFVREIPGDDPPIVLMHGFPDDHTIYERLLPLLSPKRAVAFDWHGYGRSERSELGGFSMKEHAAELEALLDALDIERAVLVGHDASGPDAVGVRRRASPTGRPPCAPQHDLRAPAFPKAPRDDPTPRRPGPGGTRRRDGQ